MASPVPNPRTPDDDSLIQGRNWFSRRLEWLIDRLTPGCAQAIRQISASLDRPQPLWERLRLRTHFLVCCYCRRYDDQVHRLRRFTIALPEHLDEALPMQLDDEVKERLKRRLRAES